TLPSPTPETPTPEIGPVLRACRGEPGQFRDGSADAEHRGPVDLVPRPAGEGPVRVVEGVRSRVHLHPGVGRLLQERLAVGPGVGGDAAHLALLEEVLLVV